MKTSSRNVMAAAGGACLLAIILLKQYNAGAPEPQAGGTSGRPSAPVETVAQPVENPAQSPDAGIPAVAAANPAAQSAPAPSAGPATPLPRTREAFLALADSEAIPAAEKRRVFFATAGSAEVPDEIRRSSLMLGLRRIEPGLWPDTAGKLLLDEAQPAWIHDALMQDLHARGHEFNLPWFDKVAASPTHALKRAAADAASTYRRLASQMTEEARRADAASVKAPD